MAWLSAAYLAGARHPKDSVPLSKELRRALAYLDARGKPQGHSDGLDELRLRREHRRSLRWMASLIFRWRVLSGPQYLAWSTSMIFAGTILPFLGFERLTETAGYIRKGSMAWQPLAPK
jgi:hypothetical protein